MPAHNLPTMPNPRELFLAQVRTPDMDPAVHEMRQGITRLKLEALDQVARTDEQRAALVMPGLYEQLIQQHVHLASHVGLGVALALTVLDEHHSGASISCFDRELRDQMNDISAELARRHGSRLARMVAEIEAQRLSWRHSHEFMSWLAFRRGDERYPAKDRLERLNAFGVQPRLLEARAVVNKYLGIHLSAALESADRFYLRNRWRLSETPEHALERYIWPILSYMPAATVKLERQRWDYDCIVESDASEAQLEAEKSKLAGLLEAQFSDALSRLPTSAIAGAF